MNQSGALLSDLCRAARRDLLLVAPFIKVGALRRMLDLVPQTIPVKCVTRWRPEEIAAGVSDLEVWPLLNERPHSSMWLRPDLHAKYYRADDHYLVGSANITYAALGWSYRPNLEILLGVNLTDFNAQEFEKELFLQAIPVDQDLYTHTLAATNAISNLGKIMPEPEYANTKYSDLTATDTVDDVPQNWLPGLRSPADLYVVYSGREDELILSSRTNAQKDLHLLSPPSGLDRTTFEAYIGAMLLQQPLVQRVDMFLTKPQRFGAVRDFLKTLPCANENHFDAERAWQTLMRWLRYFLPSRYEVVPSRHSEVLRRVKSNP